MKVETKVVIDLAEELKPEELEKFSEQAEEKGHSLTEHFKQVFLTPGTPESEAA